MKRILLAVGLAFGLAVAAEPARQEAESAENEKRSTWQEPISGISFVSLPKGCYPMGRDDEIAPAYSIYWQHIGYTRPINLDEKPQHEVCVDGFWIAQHEVTHAQWAKVMGSGAVRPGKAGNKAQGGISFAEAQAFAQRLTRLAEGKQIFRLPSEAEWEYACRAGGADTALNREELRKHAWYGVDQIDKAKPREVGQREANAFGLYDMLGNVWEWTTDSYLADGYKRHHLYNPRVDGADAATPKVIRGGSVRSEQILVRCAKRGHQPPDQPLPLIGLRLVRER